MNQKYHKKVAKMLKYVDTKITFAEVPDEISLCINISNCCYACEGCHSPYLRNDIGDLLSHEVLSSLIDKNKDITCVCIMGGDSNPKAVNNIADFIKKQYPTLKVAWYSGNQGFHELFSLDNLDFIKIGAYIKDKGPLNKETTNQIMYRIYHNENKEGIPMKGNYLENITSMFWK